MNLAFSFGLQYGLLLRYSYNTLIRVHWRGWGYWNAPRFYIKVKGKVLVDNTLFNQK